jgi:hypothetical protein
MAGRLEEREDPPPTRVFFGKSVDPSENKGVVFLQSAKEFARISK